MEKLFLSAASTVKHVAHLCTWQSPLTSVVLPKLVDTNVVIIKMILERLEKFKNRYTEEKIEGSI